MIQFINTYQTLVGSFIAIFASISLWFLKEQYDKRKSLKNNKAEIEDTFFMMARDTEESVKDLRDYVFHVGQRIEKYKDEFHVISHSKFNRVYLNEERLFFLKQGVNFVLTQQIDIATSSAKKFNSFMESIEYEPIFIFEATVKTITSGIESKEKAIEDYKKSMRSFLNKLDLMIENEIKMSQINILRPVVALSPRYMKLSRKAAMHIDLDETLNDEATFILMAIKRDLA